jgi:hypothetical protein
VQLVAQVVQRVGFTFLSSRQRGTSGSGQVGVCQSRERQHDPKLSGLVEHAPHQPDTSRTTRLMNSVTAGANVEAAR